MNWTETRDVLIAAGFSADRLPDEWQPGIDLGGADLGGAYLGGAYLRGAYLRGATLNWQSHEVIAEVLRQAAGDDIKRRMLAGLIIVSPELCWREFLALDIDPALRGWALAELRQWVKDGDNPPDTLRESEADGVGN